MNETNFSRPEFFVNRELSWLEFNQRVLEEAQNPENPLLERVKFLCIVSSNLDEFFEIRVAGIKQQIENQSSVAGPDGLSPLQTFRALRQRILKLTQDAAALWNQELQPALAQHGVEFVDEDKLASQYAQWASTFFHEEIFPVLTPLAIDPSHPFPQLLNKSLNLIVCMHRPGHPEELKYAVVQVPRPLPRLVEIPTSQPEKRVFVFLKTLIQHHIQELFPRNVILGAHAFRVTRNSDLYIDEEEAENLLRTIEEELRKRARGQAVRLEIESTCPEEIRAYLLNKFKLTPDDLYATDGPLNMLRLMPIAYLDIDPRLKDPSLEPVISSAFPPETNMFEVIRNQDVLLHHPYESFNSVVDFIEHAAIDPRVLAIKMTLYRTSGDSPIVNALIRAARNEKQVTVMVELRARFDEANNIQWARLMEEAGIHVVYGLVGLKTHCKTLLIVRRDHDRIRHYCHLGTGNYHPKTARLYTDLSLFTAHPEIGNEIAALFNTLTGMGDFSGGKHLLVAPFELAEQLKKRIDRERDAALQGRPARIFAKMNSLVDETIIQALYEASCAGVSIDLLVRGICCLRPGIPGVSENIRVRSLVGRFLEHSRIFVFENNGEPEVFLGSADLMPRNLYRRVEVCFPVLDPEIRHRVLHEIIPTFLKDNTNTRLITPDGKHRRIERGPDEPAFSAQAEFIRLAQRRHTPRKVSVVTKN